MPHKRGIKYNGNNSDEVKNGLRNLFDAFGICIQNLKKNQEYISTLFLILEEEFHAFSVLFVLLVLLVLDYLIPQVIYSILYLNLFDDVNILN